MNIKQPCIIDVSHWEIVDWDNLDPRVVGVIMKASQGRTYQDPTMISSWIGAGRRKLPRSAYHFMEINDVSAQVENYLTTCEDAGLIVSGKWQGEIEPVLDAEVSLSMTDALGFTKPQMSDKKIADWKSPRLHLDVNPAMARKTELTRAARGESLLERVRVASISANQLAAQYKAWLDLVEAELGIRPIVYSSKWMLMQAGNPIWIKDYKGWWAQYPTNPDEQSAPAYLPINANDWWLWQYTSGGQLQGIAGAVDLNVYHGSTEEWVAKYGGGVVTPPPIGGNMYQGTVITQSLNVRNVPVSGAVVGGLALNDKVEADRVENGWWHLTKIRGAATTGENWSYEGATKGYIRTDAIVNPPVGETVTVTVEHEGKKGSAVIELK